MRPLASRKCAFRSRSGDRDADDHRLQKGASYSISATRSMRRPRSISAWSTGSCRFAEFARRANTYTKRLSLISPKRSTRQNARSTASPTRPDFAPGSTPGSTSSARFTRRRPKSAQVSQDRRAEGVPPRSDGARPNSRNRRDRMLKVWGRRSSFNTQKVLWLVGELGLAPLSTFPPAADFGRLDEPGFRAMNPHGRVPVVEDERDGGLGIARLITAISRPVRTRRLLGRRSGRRARSRVGWIGRRPRFSPIS